MGCHRVSEEKELLRGENCSRNYSMMLMLKRGLNASWKMLGRLPWRFLMVPTCQSDLSCEMASWCSGRLSTRHWWTAAGRRLSRQRARPWLLSGPGAGLWELPGFEVTRSGCKPQPSYDAPHCVACPFCKNGHSTCILQKVSEVHNILLNALSQNNETYENIKLGPVQLKMLLSREPCLWS